ncbi:VOC family protein [Georgenia sp. 10Sc9-8]|uniref:VOC family protein n=1 Tax=Georgenia halotolerans TaxID=3028317 RepID=A0ABT5TYB6_9MICO|nr:VOC family protein [Georgenia halotolerans]
MSIPVTLDHLLWAVPDLTAGVQDFADLTGVTPVPGGAHPGLGTANYLVALERSDRPDGPRTCYLEIIGPDPAQQLPADQVNLGVGHVTRPTLHTWAVRPDDLDATVHAATVAGVDVGEVRSMERTTPDGRTLRWRLTARTPLPLDGVQPFLIDWVDTPHPSQADLPVLTLVDLTATAPDPAAAAHALETLGAPVPVSPDPSHGLHAVLDTPRGRVVLDGTAAGGRAAGEQA